MRRVDERVRFRLVKGVVASFLLAFVPACSSDDAAPGPNSHVTSDVDGTVFGSAYGTASVGRIYPEESEALAVEITTQPRSCGESSDRPSSGIKVMIWPQGDGASTESIEPGTYEIGDTTSSGITFSVSASVTTLGGMTVKVTSGTVTFDDASKDGYAGSFDFTVEGGQTATGTFDVPVCG